MKYSTCYSLCVLLILLGALNPSFAEKLSPEAMRLIGKPVQGSPMTLSEISAMPPPCLAIGMGQINGVFWPEGMNRDGSISILDRPENVMAKDAGWFHHYCWGLLGKHRASLAPNAMLRSGLIRQWRGDMIFIVDWLAKQKIDWQYLPVIHAEIAESYVKDKNYPMAILSANKAIELDPRYVRGYLLLQNIYEQIKDREKALAAITEGLKRVPTSKSLQRQYKQLGGHMPFPEPYPKPETAAAPPDTVTATSAIPSTMAEAASAPAATEPPSVQPPDNPYCRFCP